MIRRTPLVPAPVLGTRVLCKLECLQRTGSFKLRGAAAAVAALSPGERAAGVVTASAGNHGAGLALAGREAGVRVTVVVPEGTPAVKRARMQALGAELRVDGTGYDDSERIARALARERGARFVSPFADEAVIAGNGGSLGEEIVAECPEVRRVLVPVGGGGLLGGMARVLAPRGIEVVGVQPEANCAMHDSLERGVALTEYDGGATCAEGCEGAVAEVTYALARDHAAGIRLVSELDIERAVALCYRELGVVAECSGAVAVAALSSGAVLPHEQGATVVVVTGGNIDDDALDAILTRAEA